MKDHYNVLFLCTGNSARSIMAEAIMNYKGRAELHRLQRGEPSLGHGSTGGDCGSWRMLICPQTVSEARVGTSLRSPTPRSSISSSQSVTTLRKKSARSGRASL